jgi:hypothetical protein
MAAKGRQESGAGGDGTSATALPPEFEENLRLFSEGATALTAASIRMQMMMLEQARGMMDDFAGALTQAPEDDKADP